jgi:hypothetical protein
MDDAHLRESSTALYGQRQNTRDDQKANGRLVIEDEPAAAVSVPMPPGLRW